jgi:hypothetical protein
MGLVIKNMALVNAYVKGVAIPMFMNAPMLGVNAVPVDNITFIACPFHARTDSIRYGWDAQNPRW